MTDWIYKTCIGLLITGGWGVFFWIFKKNFNEVGNKITIFDNKLMSIEKELSELKELMVTKYVRTLEKNIAEIEKEIGCQDIRIKNLERETFKDKDRRRYVD